MKRSGVELIDEIKNAITTNAHFDKAGFLGGVKGQRDGTEDGVATTKPICLILDDMDDALAGNTDRSNGLPFVASFLKKCISTNDRKKNQQIKLDNASKRKKGDDDMGDEDAYSSDDNEDVQALAKSEQLQRQLKKDQEKFPALSRPIIMVCNDGYDKKLYPLKDLVLKVRIEGASDRRIDDRLIEILRMEGIRDLSNGVRKAII